MIKKIRRFISIVILIAFIVTSVKSPAYAQAVGDQMPRLPAPGVMVHLSPEVTPARLQGLTIHPDNALKFDFLVSQGDDVLSNGQKKIEYKKLVKYFLASLTIPDQDQWVNLSPYEKNRIIKENFGKTEMGRDLLAEDYMLKQITSTLIYPEDGLGKKFWDKIYASAWKEFHTTQIPVNTFNKVWILPDQAIVYESGNTAYILKSHLKVMLEEDYLSMQKHEGKVNPTPKNKINKLGSDIVRQVILPQLEREVNEGKNFTSLRQMYSGMVLATWYKRALKESLLGKIYADKGKVKGVDQDPRSNEAIYQRYLSAFKKGVFNYIKEDVDKYSKESIPRKYFSGGFKRLDPAMKGRNGDVKVLRGLSKLTPDLYPALREAAGTRLDLAMITLQNDGSQFSEPTPLEEKQTQAIKMAIKWFFAPEGEKNRRRLEFGQPEYNSLDPEAKLQNKDIRIYILTGLITKIIEFSNQLGVEPPLDLVSHTGRTKGNIYIDQGELQKLMARKPEYKKAWVDNNLKYLTEEQSPLETVFVPIPAALPPAKLEPAPPAAVAPATPVAPPAVEEIGKKSRRSEPYNLIYRVRLRKLMEVNGFKTIPELYVFIMAQPGAKGMTMTLDAFRNYFYNNINPPDFVIAILNDLIKEPLEAPAAAPKAVPLVTFDKEPVIETGKKGPFNPEYRARLEQLKKEKGFKNYSELHVFIMKQPQAERQTLSYETFRKYFYKDYNPPVFVREILNALVPATAPTRAIVELLPAGLIPAAEQVNEKTGAPITANISFRQKLISLRSKWNMYTEEVRRLILSDPRAKGQTLTYYSLVSYFSNNAPEKAPKWLAPILDDLLDQQNDKETSNAVYKQKLKKLLEFINISQEKMLRLINLKMPAEAEQVQEADRKILPLTMTGFTYFLYRTSAVQPWVKEVIDELRDEFNEKKSPKTIKEILDGYGITQKNNRDAEVEPKLKEITEPAVEPELELTPLIKRLRAIRSALKLGINSFFKVINQNRPEGTDSLVGAFILYPKTAKKKTPVWMEATVERIEKEFNGLSDDEIAKKLKDKYNLLQKPELVEAAPASEEGATALRNLSQPPSENWESRLGAGFESGEDLNTIKGGPRLRSLMEFFLSDGELNTKVSKGDLVWITTLFGKSEASEYSPLQLQTIRDILIRYRDNVVPRYSAVVHDQMANLMSTILRSHSQDIPPGDRRILESVNAGYNDPVKTKGVPPYLRDKDLIKIMPVLDRFKIIKQIKDFEVFTNGSVSRINAGTALPDDEFAGAYWMQISEINKRDLSFENVLKITEIIRDFFKELDIEKPENKTLRLDLAEYLLKCIPEDMNYNHNLLMTGVLMVIMDNLDIDRNSEALWVALDKLFKAHSGKAGASKMERIIRKLMNDKRFTSIVIRLSYDQMKIYQWDASVQVAAELPVLAKTLKDQKDTITFDDLAIRFAEQKIANGAKLLLTYVMPGQAPKKERVTFHYVHARKGEPRIYVSSGSIQMDLPKQNIVSISILNQAMGAENRVGGINFNSANMDFQIKRDGRGVPLPMVQQDMAQLSSIQGFEPEITAIKPAINVPIINELRQKLQSSSPLSLSV